MWKKIVATVLGLLLGLYLLDDYDPRNDVKGKRVVITGASTGIGEQMAYQFARLGASVLVTARREGRLQQVVAKCQEGRGKDAQFHYIAADMANMSSAEMVIKQAINKLGGIDYLILNHIISSPLGVWKGNHDNLTRLDTIFDVNFKAYVHLVSHAMPTLEENEGRVVAMASLSAKISQPFTIAYSASKFALLGFFNGLRQELAMRGSPVSVTVGVLGLVGTENTMKELQDYRQDILLSLVSAEDPAYTALVIIKAAAQRMREFHFPYLSMKFYSIFRDILPQTMDAFFRSVYQIHL